VRACSKNFAGHLQGSVELLEEHIVHALAQPGNETSVVRSRRCACGLLSSQRNDCEVDGHRIHRTNEIFVGYGLVHQLDVPLRAQIETTVSLTDQVSRESHHFPTRMSHRHQAHTNGYRFDVTGVDA